MEKFLVSRAKTKSCLGPFAGGRGMAWWTHIFFFGRNTLEEDKSTTKKEENALALFRRAVKSYFYENFLALLYYFLSFFTYLYLGLSIITFFLPKQVPKSFPYIIDTLSEPYLGALGVYVVVKELERRREKYSPKHRGEYFTAIWFLFFLSATLLTYFSENYQLGGLYKTIVTNALAAIIIRIGTLIR